MSDFYLGQIFLFGGDFAPTGSLACEGQIMSIAQYEALYSVIGTYFGGNGVTTFQLPDLRGMTMVGTGVLQGSSTYTIGVSAGAESVALRTGEMPAHNHIVSATSEPGAGRSPSGGIFAASLTSSEPVYAAATSEVALGAGTNAVGGGAGHNNLQPYLAVTLCIAVTGVYPSQN